MQKKNRKGFTLIELLAVIVILAIIALIAVPVIMNVITKARVSAFEDSAYGIVKAGEMYYTNKLLDAEGMIEAQEFTVVNDAFQNTKNSAETLELSGSMPSSGKVTVTKEGKVAIAISNGEYCIRKATTESKVKAEKLSDLGGTCNYKTVFTETTDGEAVPACITNNTECQAGTKVGVQVNASKKYDFYVMEDNTSENEITLLMSENLGETVAWVSKTDYLSAGGTEAEWTNEVAAASGYQGNTNKGPITALKELEDRTSGWTNIPLEIYQVEDEENLYLAMTSTSRARLITHSEAIGQGCEDYNDTCPDWLYKNTFSHGNDTNQGYWTSSAYADYSLVAWGVNCSGETVGTYVNSTGTFGIRPVITISKTIM